MERNLKNRLVGVAVLLAVAAIVLPWVLDGANRKALLADTRLPAAVAVPEAGALLAAPPAVMPAAESDINREHAPAEPEAVPPVAVAPAATPAAPAPVQPVVPAPAAPATTSAAAAPAAQPAPAAAATDPRLAALAEAWDVQVAASSAQDGADRLRDKLLGAGYKARVAHVNGLFKVFVGPELRRDEAEQMRTRLAADARVGKPKGMLVRYVP